MIYHGYKLDDKFDVLLAVPFHEDDVSVGRLALGLSHFEKLKKSISRETDKKIFVPHIDLKSENSRQRIYDLVGNVVVPSVDLVLCYAVESAAGVRFSRAAAMYHKPSINFLPEGKLISPEYSTPNVMSRVNFNSFSELEGHLINAVNDFYKRRESARNK